MKNYKQYPPEMIADCRQIYLNNKGRNHKNIEAEMHARGWVDFRKRMLYPFSYNGEKRGGWIDNGKWAGDLPPVQRIGLPRYRVGDGSFPEWLRKTEPKWTWNWAYQKYIYKKLQLVTEGDCRRLMIFVPPRHGKSELVTVRYSAWRLEADPEMNIIIGSYNQKLANRFSRKIKRIAEGRISLSKNRSSAEEWETTAGGGVRAVGVGAGITGFGGGLIIIDDPVKSRAEAESKTYRDKIWNWFNDDIYTRLEPNAAVILIQTRWHDDDLAGRLLREAEDGGEQWEVVRLPALAEEYESEPPALAGGENWPKGQSSETESFNENTALGDAADRNQQPVDVSAMPPAYAGGSYRDPLGREPGEALCRERYDRETLVRTRRKLGAHAFSSLYQQRPMPKEGGMFKPEWFTNRIDKHPDGLRWCRGYDLAVSTKTSADYTASFRCAIDKAGNLYIADGFRKRIEFPEQRRYAVKTMTAERDTQHGIELALHGQALLQDLRREVQLLGVPFRGVRVDGDKFTRALSWANLAEEGKVYLVKGPWIDDFLEEVCRFSGKGDRHDDQVDAVSLAFSMLGRKKRGFHSFT